MIAANPWPSQRDYFRQHQDEVHSTPVEIARQLPDDILRITGYCKLGLQSTLPGYMLTIPKDKAVGGVGYVGDHEAPIDYLYEDGHGFGKMGPKENKGLPNGHASGVTNGAM